ncbi:b66eebee-68d5-4bf6-82c8-46480e771835 [Thermothielavioides terrestris]|uniref:B66eebee-68d5-4bf6-82c8-46480e771835 n=1 Tax=Thermothielavioides terrestris TaxID=2587410 RepID=A0A3S5CXV0_9PEZI|nr:b66eebee-68d5-4bf6-82c8-46480e771835 [Thermothielavioides terrestris]
MADAAAQVSAFEQFVRFGTDAYGLERLLRLFQALTQLLLALPFLHPFLLSFLSDPSSPPTTEALLLVQQALTLLRGRLSALRQPLRLFRFLDTLSSACSSSSSNTNFLAASAAAAAATQTKASLTFAARSFNGAYQLLESLTFVDSTLAVPGLRVWGARRAAALALDGQRFWFLALAC